MNPLIGVLIVQVAIPDALVRIELIPTPFELLIAITLCGSDSIPKIGAICSIPETASLGTSAINDVESTITFFVSL